jgi:hypothetical protein
MNTQSNPVQAQQKQVASSNRAKAKKQKTKQNFK